MVCSIYGNGCVIRNQRGRNASARAAAGVVEGHGVGDAAASRDLDYDTRLKHDLDGGLVCTDTDASCSLIGLAGTAALE